MNARDLTGLLGKRARALFERYKFVLIVILAGILLLTIPALGGEADKAEAAAAQTATRYFDLEGMEEKIAGALSKIEGAGNVTVVLTVKTGARQVLAEDSEISQKDGAAERSASTVVVSRGSGTEEVVPVQEIFPQFQGALVVCAGGGDPAVKLKLVEAVSDLTGLGSDKITICKGK